MEDKIMYLEEDEELCTIEIDEIDCSENCGYIKKYQESIDARSKQISELLDVNLDREKVYMEALETWGEELQITVLFEEMAELQKEFCKHLRGTTTFENISDEIADVEIMLEQMKLIFELDEEVNKRKEYKISRLAKRLKIAYGWII